MALPGVHQHSEGPVVFGARHAATTMLAGDQPAVPVTGVAIGKVGRLLKHTDRAGGFFPFEDAVVGNIAPQQVAPIAKPDRAFRPAAPGVQALHGRELEPVLFKAWIERGDGRIRVTWVRTPAGRGWKSGIGRHDQVLL